MYLDTMCPGGSLWHSQGLSFGERKEGSWRFFSIFSFVVRIERVTAARKLNRGRNSWRFFCCVFFFSELLLCEPQKKKKTPKNPQLSRGWISYLTNRRTKKEKKHDKKTLATQARFNRFSANDATSKKKKKRKKEKKCSRSKTTITLKVHSTFFVHFFAAFARLGRENA